MGNYTGNLHQIVVTVDLKDKNSVKKALKDILSIDEDYVTLQDKVVEKIINEKKSFEESLDRLINFNDFKDVSRFLIGNKTFCSNYTINKTEVNNLTVFSIAYSM